MKTPTKHVFILLTLAIISSCGQQKPTPQAHAAQASSAPRTLSQRAADPNTPMSPNEAMLELGRLLTLKEYLGATRLYTSPDFTQPSNYNRPLSILTNISYIQLLRGEILARNAYAFKQPALSFCQMLCMAIPSPESSGFRYTILESLTIQNRCYQFRPSQFTPAA